MLVKALHILSFIFLTLQLVASNPVYKRYQVEDGLPSSLIYDVIQDDLGLIWIATDKGVSRFDGQNFTNYTVKDGLPHNDVFGFVKDDSGRIWLNTLDVVCYIEDNVFKTLDSVGNLGLHYHYFGKNGAHFLQSKNDRINYFFESPDRLREMGNSLVRYLIYEDSLNYESFTLNSSEVVEKPSNVFQVKEGVESVLKLQDDNIYAKYFGSSWFGDTHFWTFPMGIEFLEKGVLAHYNLEQLGFNKKIEKSFFVRNGVFLKNTEKVIFVNNEGKVKQGLNLFYDLEINKIFFDREGNYWLSSNDGLYFLSSLSADSESFYLGPQEKQSKQKATKIIKDVEGNILVATYEGNIYKYNDGNLDLIIETGLEGCRDMIQDGYGKLWVATDQFGCFRLENLDLLNSEKYTYRLNSILSGRTESLKAIFRATVKALKMGPDNRLYIASADGVTQIEFKEDHFVINKLDSTRSYSITQDLFGYVWIGRTSGISRYKDGSLIDLGPNHPVSTLTVTDLEVDSDNGLWIGSDGYGLFHDKESILCAIDELDGYIIKSLVIKDNVVWAATNKGVVSVRSLSANTDDCNYEIKSYSLAHGLASDEVNDVFIDDGFIYAATKNGVSKIPIQRSANRDKTTQSNYRSPLIIQSVEIDNIAQIIQPSYDLNHDQNNIRIEFAALSYQSLGKINYQFQMTGIDTSWYTTSDGFKEYQALQPGNYTFRLKANDVQGNALANSEILRFNISKPWWNQWWFIVGCICVTLLMMFLYVQFRISKTQNKAQKEAAINQRFAELEMQAIRSQMNPHFLFNALHSIQDYIFNNDSREANRYISSFANLMRKILDASKEKYIYIYQELDMLNLYLELEKLRFNEKFNYAIKVDEKIDKNTCEIPTMIIQPFVENAINHGLMHRPESGMLNIEIRKTPIGIRINIEDNGIGLENAQKFKETYRLDHESKGMSMINDRLELMNEMYDARIILTIKEKNPEDKKYPGTIITLELPIHE